MIKDGKNVFLDFEKHKEKFIDVFVEYYGKEHEEEIRKRFDTITYVPYHRFEFVNLYYNAKLTEYKDEIVDEYCRISGKTADSQFVRDAIWSEDGSSIFAAANEGNNLDECEFLFEQKEEIENYRQEVSAILGLKGDNISQQIIKEAQNLKQALINVEKKHPCQIFEEMERAITNRNHALQMFLCDVNKYSLSLTENDIKLINKTDFDSYDAECLDCKYITHGSSVNEPGLSAYFTTKATQEAEKSSEEKIRNLVGRNRMLIAMLGFKELQYVTPDELFYREYVDNRQDFLNRLKKEYDGLIQKYPQLELTTKQADAIENVRKVYARNMYAGCSFAGNLNSNYNDGTHDANSKDRWVTQLEFLDYDGTKPDNTIYFDEGDYDYVDTNRLLRNLIHEINHAIGHGKAVIDKNGKKGYSSSGLLGYIRKVENGKYMTDYISYNEGILQFEENCNERMASEITELFLKKYENVFKSSDINLIDEDNKMYVTYDFYSFMTEKFWNKYKDILKEHRVTDGATIFYDVDKRPTDGNVENIMNAIAYKYLKNARPDILKKRGSINYEILNRLGQLIMEFKSDVLDSLIDLHIKADELLTDDFSSIKCEGYTPELAQTLDDYKYVADRLFDEMQMEEDKINRRQDFFDGVKDKKDKVVDKAKGILGKKQKPSTKDQVIENIIKKSKKKETSSEDENSMDK